MVRIEGRCRLSELTFSSSTNGVDFWWTPSAQLRLAELAVPTVIHIPDDLVSVEGKKTRGLMEITRRDLFKGSAAVAIAGVVSGVSVAADDPLPSWHDGPAKKAILDFVHATVNQSSPKFVPPEQRIATFDQDGTLWVEHPMYTQVVYCLKRVPVVVKAKPELANVEPFKTVLSGDRDAIAKLTMDDLFKILGATLSGMDVDHFQAEVKQWLDHARDASWKRPYTELTYLPMTEVLNYMRVNGYRTYIVTGGGQDFVRVYSDKTYGIPPPSKWLVQPEERALATTRVADPFLPRNQSYT